MNEITVTWSRKYDGVLCPQTPERDVLLVFLRNASEKVIGATTIHVLSRVSIWYEGLCPGTDASARIVEHALRLAAEDHATAEPKHHGKFQLREAFDEVPR